MILSKYKVRTVEAYNRGYRIINNECINPDGILIKGTVQKLGYKSFGICGGLVKYHQLVAYEKYKDDWLYSNLLVRHLDSDPTNNSWGNIVLGTSQDNTNDIPAATKARMLINANNSPLRLINVVNSNKNKRTLTTEQVLTIRKDYTDGLSVANISRKYNIDHRKVQQITSYTTYKFI